MRYSHRLRRETSRPCAETFGNYPPFCSDFKSDEHLVELAKKACGELGYACHTGRIVSGEQFISDSSVKANIIKEFDPLAVDMETSGIAHAAFRNGVCVCFG